MARLSAWMGAGAVVAGVSAAMIIGADSAGADTGADTTKAGVSGNSANDNERPGPRRSNDRASGILRTGKSVATSNAAPRTRTIRTAAADTPEPTSANTVDRLPAPTVKAAEPRVTSATRPAVAAASPLTVPDLINSVVFDFLGVVVTIASGAPTVPPGSDVVVRSSTLVEAQGHTVPADWYYPDTDEPPQRMILLQHGYLGVSAMYSWTAAYLAQSTNSVVVVPTLSSNRYVDGGFWLGDDQVYQATANLFLGDREALTASALAAGYGKKYGTVTLPDEFVLVGHSLGGGVVSGAAGYYAAAVAASGAENHLAGVILLDAAPPGDTLPDALDKLHELDTYTPVIELGAPKATISKVDVALNEDRPGNFNGVVLANGMHLDAMQGGTWLIQFAAHVMYGGPSTAQNLSAAQTLIAGWTNDMFAGQIDPATGTCGGDDCAGIYGGLGTDIQIATPDGPATGAVIGEQTETRLVTLQTV